MDGGPSDPIVAGEYSWTVVHQEIAHALGIDIIGTTLENDPEYDSHKYTITSYNEQHPGMGPNAYSATDGTAPYAKGLQLYDIAALQEIYGRQWNTRNGDTTYKAGASEAFGAAATPLIYSIWDGGGTDTISADGFYESGIGAGAIIGAEIDLRQGAFSSIGSSVTAARATDNLAIAFHTIIENATGSDKDDIIVGNA